MTATERGLMIRAAVQSGGGLLNQRQVASVIGRNKSTTNWLVRSAGFPRPICNIGERTEVWLHEEVTAWLRKHPKAEAHA